MVKTLEKGQDKIQEICDALKKETLEPAEREAEKIIAEAHVQAEKIIREAHERGEKQINDARRKIDEERAVFQSALEQGAKQAIESLRQSVEKSLFNRELAHQVQKESKDPKVVAKIIEAMVNAIEKEGVKSNLAALIPQTAKPEEINALLASEILKKLEKESAQVSGFAGGAEVQLKGKELTLVLNDEVLRELLASYLRKDFRELIFSA